MNLWVIGTGESSLYYKNEMRKLGEHDTLAFQSTFPHCIKHFGFIPKYWTWFDPEAAMDGLNYLIANKSNKELFKMKIVLPKTMLDTTTKNYSMYAGTSPLTREKGGWRRYINALNKIKTLGLEIVYFPVISAKYISQKRGNFEDLISNFVVPEKRFNYEKVIFSTELNHATLNQSSNSSAGINIYENKLSMCVLPTAVWLGAENVYIIGFDGMGARFWNRKHKGGKGYAKLTSCGGQKYLKRWKEWETYLNVCFYSVIEDKYTKINKYIGYMPFGQALERSSLRTFEHQLQESNEEDFYSYENMWVIGPGESCISHKKDMMQLKGKNYNTIAVQRTFPHMVTHFGVVPKFWTWTDPETSIYGMDYLLKKYKKTPKEKLPDLTIVLSDFVAAEDVNEFLKYSGHSNVSKKEKTWKKYINTLKAVEELGFNVVKIPSESKVRIQRCKAKSELCKKKYDNWDDLKIRFNGEKMYIGSSMAKEAHCDPSGKQLGENKLTASVLPIAEYLGAKNVFIIGFEGHGGRFFNKKNYLKNKEPNTIYAYGGTRSKNKSSGCASNHTLRHLTTWKKWGQSFEKGEKMKFYSLVKNNKCRMNKYIEYLSFKQAMDMCNNNDKGSDE